MLFNFDEDFILILLNTHCNLFQITNALNIKVLEYFYSFVCS